MQVAGDLNVTCSAQGWGKGSYVDLYGKEVIASKVICNDTYSNKSWSIVSQGVFQLHKINQMEHMMCQYLNLELNVELGRVVGRKCVDKELQ